MKFYDERTATILEAIDAAKNICFQAVDAAGEISADVQAAYNFVSATEHDVLTERGAKISGVLH